MFHMHLQMYIVVFAAGRPGVRRLHLRKKSYMIGPLPPLQWPSSDWRSEWTLYEHRANSISDLHQPRKWTMTQEALPMETGYFSNSLVASQLEILGKTIALNETVQPRTVGYGALPQHFLSLQSTARPPYSVIRLMFLRSCQELPLDFDLLPSRNHP